MPPADGAFDQALRDVLLEARPVSGASSALGDLVRRVPDQHPAGFRPPSVTGWVASAARLAAVMAVVSVVGIVVALAGLSTMSPDVASPSAPPSAPAFDPSTDGVGIVTQVDRTLQTVPWLAAGVAVVILAGVVARRRPPWKLAAVVTAAMMFGAAYVVSSQPGPQYGFAYGPQHGIEIEYAPSITDGPDGYHVIAAPGETFGVAFNVMNRGSLPIRILGIVERVGGA